MTKGILYAAVLAGTFLLTVLISAAAALLCPAPEMEADND